MTTTVVVMPVLARAKRRVRLALGGDQLILADAAETKICVLLSVSTLLGLALYAITEAAWLDPVAGFVIAVLAIHGAVRRGKASSSRTTTMTTTTEVD